MKIPPGSRTIPGFRGFYRADTGGQIWSCYRRGRSKDRKGRWRLLKLTLREDGYLWIYLWDGDQYVARAVHRLVLEAFVGPRPKGLVGRHFPDNTPTNNHLSNLQWSTQRANLLDKIQNGTHPAGERNPSAKLTWKKVGRVRALITVGLSDARIGSRFLVSPSTISDVRHGRSWKTDYRL